MSPDCGTEFQTPKFATSRLIFFFFQLNVSLWVFYYDTATTYSVSLNAVIWASAPSVYIPLGGVDGMRARACACVSLYVLRILQRAHLVAMCQCHWPLCSPSGWYTHSASSDSCSIRGPSRTTDTQTYQHMCARKKKEKKAWSVIKNNNYSNTHCKHAR